MPFSRADRNLINASSILGASRIRTFMQVVLPLSNGGGVTDFAHTLGEFGVVLMVGGNIPGVTRTVSIAIDALRLEAGKQVWLVIKTYSCNLVEPLRAD